MAKVVCIGVRFRNVGKIYYFKKDDHDVHDNDDVIVETIRGVEYGHVVKSNIEIEETSMKTPLKPIIRVATDEDREKHKKNKDREPEAFLKCKELISKHQLPMKLLGCEFTFDEAKVLFYFSADNRIDFRELVKDLASVFHIRIELRQVGVRDETKILGGCGVCGRPFCCATFLSDFKPATIKMVKEQGLSLNPSKISGTCGRLMCCLKNEEESYEELNRNLPMIGDSVTTKDGYKGTVYSINTLKQLVKVTVELKNGDKERKEYEPKDLRFKKRPRVEAVQENEKELKDLVELENKDVKAD
ncbi:MAG: stage 0 sporulation family protein, partial [Lachnospiraceae bacterium]|nr:stage 0 sporulation family protein [Lachnospiraceae bacterium]